MPVYQQSNGAVQVRQVYGGKSKQLMAVRLVNPDNGLYRTDWLIGTLGSETDEAAINFCKFLKSSYGEGYSNAGLVPSNSASLKVRNRSGRKMPLEHFLDYRLLQEIASDPELGPIL